MAFSSVLVLWVIVVFKQKMAYDMRISDWSSDVCSSDLDHREMGGRGRCRRILVFAVAVAVTVVGEASHIGALQCRGIGGEGGAVGPLARREAAFQAREGVGDGGAGGQPPLGTASCRERVCKYV